MPPIEPVEQEHIPLSRNPYGKCDDAITFRCPYEVRQKMRALAYSLGMGESEFMLDLLMVRIDGVEHLASVDEARRRAVSGLPAVCSTNDSQGPNP